MKFDGDGMTDADHPETQRIIGFFSIPASRDPAKAPSQGVFQH